MTRGRWTFLLAIFLAGPLVVVVPSLLFPISFHKWVQTLTAWVVLAALPASLLFPLLYMRSAWWRSMLGTAMMLLEIGVGWIVVTASLRVLHQWPHVARTYAGDPVNIDLVRVAGYGWVMVSVNYMLAALLLLRRQGTDLHSDDAEVRAQHEVDHPGG